MPCWDGADPHPVAGCKPDPKDYEKWSVYRKALNEWHTTANKADANDRREVNTSTRQENQTIRTGLSGELPGSQYTRLGEKLIEEAGDVTQSYLSFKVGGVGVGAPAPTPPTMPRPPSNKPKNDKNKAAESAGGKGVGGVVLLGLGLAAAKLAGLL